MPESVIYFHQKQNDLDGNHWQLSLYDSAFEHTVQQTRNKWKELNISGNTIYPNNRPTKLYMEGGVTL